MVRRFLRVTGLVAALGLLAAAAANAAPGGMGTVTMTTHGHNDTLFSSSVVNPCTGASGTLTAVAANDVFHVTFFTAPGADEFWVTGTAEGTATFTPDDPSGVAASGHFASWFGESGNNKNDVQHDTNTFQLIGTDGSRTTVHMTDHLSTNANGVVTVSFSNFKFSCG
jgi:hypothetical protein